MPTIALKVQQDGAWQGWSSLTGASFGYQAVDDSDGVTHDSATTYLTLPKLNLALFQGRVSFPVFLQAEGLVPTSITINVVAQRGGALRPRLQIGFYQGGLVGFDASMFDPTASWSLAQRTFSTNPITGQPWSQSDLVGLEACVQNEAGAFGNNDITLISGSLTGAPLSNWAHPEPVMHLA